MNSVMLIYFIAQHVNTYIQKGITLVCL